MATRGRTSSSGISFSRKPDLTTLEGLERYASKMEYKPPEEREPLSALRKVGGWLNVGSATIAGAARGVLRDDVSVIQGAIEGFKKRETFSFSNILKEDLGFKDTSQVGMLGFAADVLFDPITYLTFGAGAGLKIGGRAITKTGTKALQQAEREIIQKGVDRGKSLVSKKLAEDPALDLVKQGMMIDEARKVAGRRATPVVNDLMQRTIGKKGITEEATEEFLKEGISMGTINTLRQLGPQILDKGGVKWFGKTLVSSKAISDSVLGRASRALGETEIAKALKNTAGKMFIPDFKVDPKIAAILGKAERQRASAIEKIIEKNSKLFEGLSDDQASKFFDTVYNERLKLVGKTAKEQEETIKKINELFPELKVKDVHGALRALDKVDDVAIKATTDIQNSIKQITKQRKKLTANAAKESVKLLKAGIKALPKETAGAIFGGAKNADLLLKDIDKTIKSITGKAPKTKKEVDDIIAELNRKLVKIQNEITEKKMLIEKLIDIPAKNKLAQRATRLEFDDEALQKLSDTFFEGDGALYKNIAKAAGIAEENAEKFYIPALSIEKQVVKDFAVGRNMSSPKMGWMNPFKGKIGEDDLVKNPFEAFTKRQIEIVTARAKEGAFRTVARTLGRTVDELSEFEAKKLKYKKVSRTGPGGKVEAWFPEEIAEHLNEFMTPSTGLVSELGRVTGFDWATSIFKSYVTALFPAFHFRNMTSNQFQNMLKIGMDVANPNMQKYATMIALGKNLDKKITTKTGKVLTLREVRNMVKKESNILDASGPFGKTELFIKEAKIKLAKKGGLPNLNPLSRENIILKKARGIGTTLEAQSKMVSIISGLVNGKTIKQSIKQAEEALFDYSKLTKFEMDVMRRLIPFYTFGRKNFELQMRALMTQPGKIAAQLKFFRGVSNSMGEGLTEDDINSLPDYILEGVGVKAGIDEAGRNLFISGFGLPIEEFLSRFSGDDGIMLNFYKELLTQSNPILKFPAERATGQDFFRDRPIAELSNAQDFKVFLDMLPEKISKEMKELIEYREISGVPVYVNGKKVREKTKVTANPFALHLLRNLPTSRITGTVGFLSDEEQLAFSKYIRFFSGVRGFSIDKEQQRYFNELQRKEELIMWLERMGVLKTHEIQYIPKKTR